MPSEPAPQLQFGQADGALTVKALTPHLDEAVKDDLYAAAERLRQSAGPRRVVLNLEPVKSFNSAAIGMLINFQKRVHDAGGRLRLCHLDPYVLDLFRLTRVDQLFKVCDTEAQALASFAERGGPGKSQGGGGGGRGSWVSRIFGGK